MIIRKTVKQIYRAHKGSGLGLSDRREYIIQDTYWFLFIPVYTVEHLVEHFI